MHTYLFCYLRGPLVEHEQEGRLRSSCWGCARTREHAMTACMSWLTGLYSALFARFARGLQCRVRS